jgi:hypothetical protein
MRQIFLIWTFKQESTLAASLQDDGQGLGDIPEMAG